MPTNEVRKADDGRLAGIEVVATVGATDLKELVALREVAGKRFHNSEHSQVRKQL